MAIVLSEFLLLITTVRPFVLCSYGHCIVWIPSSNYYCSSFCSLFLWPLYCLNSFFELLLFVLLSFVLMAIVLSEFLLLITTVRPFVLCSYGHCIVCPSSMYGLDYLFGFLQAFLKVQVVSHKLSINIDNKVSICNNYYFFLTRTLGYFEVIFSVLSYLTQRSRGSMVLFFSITTFIIHYLFESYCNVNSLYSIT